MVATFEPPSWLAIPADRYRRTLNRQAVSISKGLRKHGGAVPVKAVMDAVHAAYHRCDGLDPYDGMPLRGELLEDWLRGGMKLLGAERDGQWDRLPMVGQIHAAPGLQFEIVSWQTWMAKGDRTAEQYIAHCRAVVTWADATGRPDADYRVEW